MDLVKLALFYSLFEWGVTFMELSAYLMNSEF